MFNKKYPNNMQSQDNSSDEFNGVYAGPKKIENTPNKYYDTSPMQCVYAGPEFMRNAMNYNNDMRAGQVVTNSENDGRYSDKYCSNCHSRLLKDAKFCNECGTPVSKDE